MTEALFDVAALPVEPKCAHCLTPVGAGMAFCPWCSSDLPKPLQLRLARGSRAVQRCPDDATIAATYQARVLEAAVWLNSPTQGDPPDDEAEPP